MYVHSKLKLKISADLNHDIFMFDTRINQFSPRITDLEISLIHLVTLSFIYQSLYLHDGIFLHISRCLSSIISLLQIGCLYKKANIFKNWIELTVN